MVDGEFRKPIIHSFSLKDPLQLRQGEEIMVKIRRSARMERKHIMAVIGCATLVMVYFIFDMNSPWSSVPPQVPESMINRQEHSTNREAWDPPTKSESAPVPISCDRSHREYDICAVNGPAVLDPTRPIIYTQQVPTEASLIQKLRPYPRKWEQYTMSNITEVTLATSEDVPQCLVRHAAPALVFSAGGYTGNFFHDFNDGFIPLFLTMSSYYGDSDNVFLVISKARSWWKSKYRELLRAFSRYPIIDLDDDMDTHCFTSVTVGLVSHGFMTIDPKKTPSGTSFNHFQGFLRKAYGSKPTLGKDNFLLPSDDRRPRLVLASRSGTVGRVILNQNELKRVAIEEGFDVIEFEPKSKSQLHRSYSLIQSSHAMIGVHGAALTHSLFLRPGSTFLQIIPIGAKWVSEACFGNAAKDLGLKYMKYDIDTNESSLVEKYGAEHPLLKDAPGLNDGWKVGVMDVYLKEQDVKLNLVRFRDYLKKMYDSARFLMDEESK